ncbi:MAG: hypothetical protein WKF30_13355 [Pyrinomonadaceae bacterium]
MRVALNQESSVNVALQAEGVSGGVVDVTAAGEALVQTENSQLGRNFETRQVQDLPIFNDSRALALLSPNVVAQAAGVSGDGGSVGGTRSRANTFNVDGVDNNSPDLTGQQVNIIQDSIAEVSILPTTTTPSSAPAPPANSIPSPGQAPTSFTAPAFFTCKARN